MMTIATQTRKMIHTTLIAGLAAMTFMTATASATNYCDEPKVEQVYARSDYTKDTHIHLDVACPHGYEAIACGFDMYGKDDKGLNKFFVAVNDATPFKFDSKHNGHKLDGDYGCHFRVNNFKPYFPGHHDFYWGIVGTASCVQKDCVDRFATHDYYDESRDAIWFPEWDEWRH